MHMINSRYTGDFSLDVSILSAYLLVSNAFAWVLWRGFARWLSDGSAADLLPSGIAKPELWQEHQVCERGIAGMVQHVAEKDEQMTNDQQN